MINQVKPEECYGCEACAAVCPQGCICMRQDGEGFFHPVLEEAACVACGRCLSVCPAYQGKDASVCQQDTRETDIACQGARGSSKARQGTATRAFAAYNQDIRERFAGSSGSVFVLLAAKVIEAGGVVIGAAFGEGFQVAHRQVDTVGELYRLQGSKYVQSRIGDVFLQAAEHLWEKRQVLFSGTPCQIEGLLDFLGGDVPGLITLDLLCTGVPSPGVWKDYLALREKQAGGSRVCAVSFRDKSEGWEKYRIRFQFENGLEYSMGSKEDPYMQGFIRGAYLRPSCYRCGFKGIERRSDITLGDFWGIKKEKPECYDPYGVTAVFTHSKKGEELLKGICGKLFLKELPVGSALNSNRNALESSVAFARRERFYEAYGVGGEGLCEAIQKAVGQDIGQGRLRQYFSLLNQWVQNLHKQKRLGERLRERGVRKIGVVGLGDIGRRFQEELVSEGITPVFALDDSKAGLEQEARRVGGQGCDLVVVCSFVDFYELREKLVRAGIRKESILSLKELVAELGGSKEIGQ